MDTRPLILPSLSVCAARGGSAADHRAPPSHRRPENRSGRLCEDLLQLPNILESDQIRLDGPQRPLQFMNVGIERSPHGVRRGFARSRTLDRHGERRYQFRQFVPQLAGLLLEHMDIVAQPLIPQGGQCGRIDLFDTEL